MKTFEFKQMKTASIVKAGIVAFVYLTAVFLIFYVLYGGIYGMANKVNSFGSGKAVGLIIGAVVLGPFFVILQFIHPKISVEITPDKIITKSKNNHVEIINLSSIGAMELNVSKINKLDIYDNAGNLLTAFNPYSRPEVLEQIIGEICQKINFAKTFTSENYLGKTLEKATYKRQ